MESKHWHFPMACPSCRAAAGMPYRATTSGADDVCVSIRCAACRHTWDESGQPAVPLMLVKPDRRRTASPKHAPAVHAVTARQAAAD
ncbi:MAG TPA: hypothetical protein VFZ31_11515 [Vicinamibacterales bacterium]